MFMCEKDELGRAACWRRGPLSTLIRWDVPAADEHARGRRLMELNVPCPSSIRWSARLDALGISPPWRSALTHPHERTTLYAFVGTNNTPTKGHIMERCRCQPAAPQSNPDRTWLPTLLTIGAHCVSHGAAQQVVSEVRADRARRGQLPNHRTRVR